MPMYVDMRDLVKMLEALILSKCGDAVTKAHLIGIVESWLVNGSLADAGKAVEEIRERAKSCDSYHNIVRLATMILERRLDDKALELTKQ